MEQILDLVKDLGVIQQIALVIGGGAILPGVVTLVLQALRLPLVRGATERGCYLAGKLTSIFLTNRLGNAGRKLEDGLQEVLKEVILKSFNSGLDHDD